MHTNDETHGAGMREYLTAARDPVRDLMDAFEAGTIKYGDLLVARVYESSQDELTQEEAGAKIGLSRYQVSRSLKRMERALLKAARESLAEERSAVFMKVAA